MAGLDLEDSYKQVDNKISSYKTFSEVKSEITKAQQKTENQSTPPFSVSKFQEDAADLERKIKKKTQNTFQKLLNMLLSLKGSGSDTFKFIIRKLKRAIDLLRTKLVPLMTKVILKSLGCDVNQPYSPGVFYVKVSNIDLFKILLENPTTKVGKLLYEPRPWNQLQIKRSSNRGLYDAITDPSQTFEYFGFSSRKLFDFKFVEINPTNGDATGWYQITLPPDATNPFNLAQFLSDYYKTIAFFDLKTLIANLLEAIFGIVSIKVGTGVLELQEKSKFQLLIERILGLCFDDEQEISVSGQAKTPELDDTGDDFFELVGADTSIIEQRADQISNQVIELETCDNILLPVDADAIIDNLESINFVDNDGAFEDSLSSINNLLSNSNWKLSIPYPQISVSLDFNFAKKIPLAVITTILSPKVLLPFFIMMKSLGTFFDEQLDSLSGFLKQFKKLSKLLISEIGAEFVRTLYEEVKKDIQTLVILVIRLIIRDENGQIGRMIERILFAARVILGIIRDYRQCKSIIDALLQLFSLIPNISNSIPKPILLLANTLPGYSPNRAFIGTIEQMQKIGLPTGPLPDGSPNLNLQAVFSQLKGQDEEQKLNGKLAAAVIVPPGGGICEVKGKSI